MINFGSTMMVDGFMEALWDVLNGCVAAVGGRARLVGRFRVSVPYPRKNRHNLSSPGVTKVVVGHSASL